MTLLLRRSEIEGLLDLPEAIRVTEDALREQAAGDVVPHAPAHVETPNGGIRVLGGALAARRRAGVRANFTHAATPGGGVALLFDVETADLLAVMAYPFGTLRTAAVFALATDRLGAPDAGELAMIGTGRNALGLLRAACAVRPIERIRVYGRDAERRRAFVARAHDELGPAVTGAASAREATDGAQLIYVATSSPEPVLIGDAVPAGAFVASMGTPAELEGTVYRAADRVLVTARRHEERYADVWGDGASMRHTLLELDRGGDLAWADVGEFADVIAGAAPARRDGETIVLRESQGGYGDVALANAVFEAALAQGLGMQCDVR